MKKQISQSISHLIETPSFEYLAPLFYFQIFSHPLTFQEVCKFSQAKFQNPEVANAFFERGIEEGLFYLQDGYYLLEDNQDWINKREENEQRAQQYLKKTKKIVQLMRRFPFVEAIFISGSTSKGVVPEKGDIDYFIITKPGRLWLTRSLLVLFKKVFLLNSHRYFCINYLIDTDHLEIEEKNRFTATEIATLLPVFKSSYYKAFWDANRWIETYYPNVKMREPLIQEEIPHSKLKIALEKILNGRIGEQLDIWAMQLSIKHWKRKFKSMDTKHFKVALKSRPYVSKHHPQNFQIKVTKRFQDNVKVFEEKHDFLFKKKKKGEPSE